MTHRFYLNEDNRVMDALNPANNEKAEWFEEYDHQRNEQRFRELLLWRHLGTLVHDLIINTNQKESHNGGEYQPVCQEANTIWCALHTTIIASLLNTLDVAMSVQHKFDGKLKREKRGWQDGTSLSLFVDDVERLLRDLYGESDNEAIDRVRSAVLVTVRGFTEHLRKDLWQEHEDAWTIDYGLGIGVPEGYCIGGTEHRAALKATHDLEVRARAVRFNPTAFSKYTVEFVNELYATWPTLAGPAEYPESGLSDETLEESAMGFLFG